MTASCTTEFCGQPEVLRDQLQTILEQTSGSENDPDYTALDAHLEGQGKVVLFGAGNMGRKVLSALRSNGAKVVAFSDNDRALWDSWIEGVQVLAPESAADRFRKDSLFLVSLWHPCTKSEVCSALWQLRNLKCNTILFPKLFWRYASQLLPLMFWSMPSHLATQADKILAIADLLEDRESRRAFLQALRLRLLGDFEGLDKPVPGAQYFPRDLYKILPNEYFIDCGAYDGDTVADFINESNSRFRAIEVFEADPLITVRLRKRLLDLKVSERVYVHEKAVGTANGTVNFASNAAVGGSICQSGGVSVPCVSIDSALAGKPASFIKMDIEGAELGALEGAVKTITNHRPVLAICVYHRPHDIWRIPLRIHELMPDASLHFRSHRADGWDLVCYAVPPERKISSPGRN